MLKKYNLSKPKCFNNPEYMETQTYMWVTDVLTDLKTSSTMHFEKWAYVIFVAHEIIVTLITTNKNLVNSNYVPIKINSSWTSKGFYLLASVSIRQLQLITAQVQTECMLTAFVREA